MIGKRYTEEFKIEAVKQVTERVYSVASQKVELVISRNFQALKASPDQVYYAAIGRRMRWQITAKGTGQKMESTTVFPVYAKLCAEIVVKHRLK